MSNPIPVCDYEGSDYRARFWQNQGRDYEDGAERVALRRPRPGQGAGELVEGHALSLIHILCLLMGDVL